MSNNGLGAVGDGDACGCCARFVCMPFASTDDKYFGLVRMNSSQVVAKIAFRLAWRNANLRASERHLKDSQCTGSAMTVSERKSERSGRGKVRRKEHIEKSNGFVKAQTRQK
ncbi:hypothetical protein BUPH_08455 (plasmid) [Paraburkholderia phenoliruptrix BR3459a]|uniref:Uncharacterized protein n=1 Tax=Paraburkholderia phenoliruptrix BR3459a TaxID=1229205 RepID=K0E296_9BURK|nr:hypothetical protein BUPH_08455 [Paraburkholderia phenoliruptrix BR3459a]